ncbi:hypothetical protein [Streptococcus salivarius]|uniref:hypothetical protein n=1 Tax=Streptococcus salivarius TaxID=1304 RepID=UPI003219298F
MLHIGTVGKIMPVVVTQGILTYMKELLKGVNALSQLIQLASTLDLYPALTDQPGQELSPLPTWSFLRDFMEQYDVSTALYAAGYLNVLHLQQTPQELLNIIIEQASKALSDFDGQLKSLQEREGLSPELPSTRILTYQELVALCRQQEGGDACLPAIDFKEKELLENGESYQMVAFKWIIAILEWLAMKEPVVVIGFAPPYYPAMNSRHLQDSLIRIEQVIQDYQNFLARDHWQLMVKEYFKGICDMSYTALEESSEAYQTVLDSLAVADDTYELDLKAISELNIPSINLGPWGKELHRRGERVYASEFQKTVPYYLIYLLHHFKDLIINE